jgi:hypothetical protein
MSPLPPRFLAPIDSLKIPAQVSWTIEHRCLATVINDGDKFATSVNSRMPHNRMNAKKKKHKALHGRDHHKGHQHQWHGQRNFEDQSLNAVLKDSFLFGVVQQFVGSESGQKQSVTVTLLQNMVYNTILSGG